MQLHCFTLPDTAQGVAVLWSEGQRASVSLARLPGEVTVLDLMGRATRLGEAGKAFTVSFERAPVYLTYPLNCAERMAAALAKAPVTNEQPVVLEAAFAADLTHLGARLHNVTNVPQSAELVGPGGRQAVLLAPGESRRVLLPLTQPLTQSEGHTLTVQLRGNQDTQEAAVDVALSALSPVPATAGLHLPPLTYWQGQAPHVVKNPRAEVYPPDPTVGWKSAADLSVQAWWGWDERYLHFAARVHDPVHYATAEGANSFSVRTGCRSRSTR